MNKLQKVQEALEKLSKLGNEPHLGNSNGNVMAQKALAELEEFMESEQSYPYEIADKIISDIYKGAGQIDMVDVGELHFVFGKIWQAAINVIGEKV